MVDDNRIMENQVALFNLLCAIFYKLTGHIPTVRIWTKDGAVLTDPSLGNIIYPSEVS